MVDIVDEVRRVLDSVEPVTLDEVVVTARRRRSRRRRRLGVSGGLIAVAAAVIVPLLLVTSTQSAHVVVGPTGTTMPGTPLSLSQAVPSGSFIDDRLVHPLSVDGGQLTLTPLPANQHPTLDAQQANTIVGEARSYNGGVAVPLDFGVAEVTISTNLYSVASTTPRYDHRMAWVAFVAQPTDIFCGAPVLPSLAPSGTQPQYFEAVILDANTGTGVIDYRSRGFSFCGGSLTGPSVQPSNEIISVPWTALGNSPTNTTNPATMLPPSVRPDTPTFYWVLRYTIPKCASAPGIGQSVSNSGADQLSVQFQEPLDPPAACKPATTVTTTFGPEPTPIAQIAHAPTEVVTPAIEATPSLSSQLVLPTTRIKQGRSIPARVVVINDTGSAIDLSGCQSIFQVLLVSSTYHPTQAWPLCLQSFIIPTGTSTYAVQVFAFEDVCAASQLVQPSSNCPPLPTGRYQATTYEQGNAVPLPQPVPIEITP